jgi:hypothetical protein
MRENREIPCLARVDGKPEGLKRTEAPWPRVPRDGKSGEGERRGRTSPRLGIPLVRVGKAGGRNPTMHGQGKSDRSVVPTKPSNKAGQPAAEAAEGRGLTKENAGQQNTLRTQSRENGVTRALDRVRQAVLRKRPEQRVAAMI